MTPNKKTRISTQVSLLACGIFIAAIVGISLLAYLRASSIFDSRGATELGARLKLIESQFETFDATAKSNADRLSHVFESMLGGNVRVDPGRTIQVGEHASPAVTANSGTLNLDFSQVDGFSRMTGGTATVFVRMGDNFLRVTTSVKKQDGSRALGTLLDTKHPAFPRMLEGTPYLGKASLFGRDYMTKYSPVKDAGGRTVAILFVGFDITEGLAKLHSEIGAARIGEKGHYFVIDASQQASRGELVVHPEAKGKNVSGGGLEAYADILQQGQGALEKDGRLYVFTKLDSWQRIFGASVDLGELHSDAVVLGNLLGGLGLAVILAGCAAIYFSLHRKLRPLELLARDAERFGSGDLTVRSQVSSADEAGELARAFNGMADQVRDLVVRVKRASDSVREAVVLVRNESRHVLDGSRTQSESASRVAAALEEVNASLTGVTDNAQDSRELSQKTNQLSVQGEAVALKAADETAAIATSVRASAQAIASLNMRSEQISDVVKVIKDIADQTNLLALNAAIEAARAGEQGRGFAVVADEVRKLAERTSHATIEIGTMISAIQKETSDAVTGMRGGSERVEEGVRLVKEAVDALTEIRTAAEMAVAKSAEISLAMNEQSVAGTEIATNVERIARMADENSAAAARSQESVSRLEALASDLTALTAGLKVGT
ncbi:MAG: methyl-accepting chemotaxis protein [Betaproteobacteria bacterium]|nr:methyl-accepting chemotaxis protein [Betaproteobacteria bacterium]